MSFATYSRPLPLREVRRDQPRVIDVLSQWLGMDGGHPGTGGKPRRTFLYSQGVAAAVVGTITLVNVISDLGMYSDGNLFRSVVEEGSSWLTVMLFFWIVWLGWRMAPPSTGLRWKLLLHFPVALTYSVAHVGSFLLLRSMVFRLVGSTYDYGPLVTRFLYEFRKDTVGYILFLAGITLVDHLLHHQAAKVSPARSATFDIRDGAKIWRVELDEILAVSSAGNYVEFMLRDGRRPLMRSALSALESQLAPGGFLRTHRSWLINSKHVTAIRPEGSGDYAIELGGLVAPLSRRFPDALAELRRR
jgi:hypothetical protein